MFRCTEFHKIVNYALIARSSVNNNDDSDNNCDDNYDDDDKVK